MPKRPLHECSIPSCHTLTAGRFCIPHELEQRRQADQRRGTAAHRGYGAEWRRYRARFLAEHPWCVDPFTVHRAPVKATQVDHITPHKGDPALFWDPANHQPLCASCGGRKSAVEPGGRAHFPSTGAGIVTNVTKGVGGVESLCPPLPRDRPGRSTHTPAGFGVEGLA